MWQVICSFLLTIHTLEKYKNYIIIDVQIFESHLDVYLVFDKIATLLFYTNEAQITCNIFEIYMRRFVATHICKKQTDYICSEKIVHPYIDHIISFGYN